MCCVLACCRYSFLCFFSSSFSHTSLTDFLAHFSLIFCVTSNMNWIFCYCLLDLYFMSQKNLNFSEKCANSVTFKSLYTYSSLLSFLFTSMHRNLMKKITFIPTRKVLSRTLSNVSVVRSFSFINHEPALLRSFDIAVHAFQSPSTI